MANATYAVQTAGASHASVETVDMNFEIGQAQSFVPGPLQTFNSW